MKKTIKIIGLTIMCYSFGIISLSLGGESIKENKTISSENNQHAAAGFSAENPIIIKKAKEDYQLKNQQQDYIKKQYEGYYIMVDSLLLEKGNRFIQLFVLTNDEGEYAKIFFDITDSCKKYRKFRSKDMKERIKKLEELEKQKKGSS